MNAASIVIYVSDAKILSYPIAIARPRERLRYIQAMRAVAICIVIATHCRDPFSDSTFIRSGLADVAFRHINIVFTFISGFLFQFLMGNFHYKSYIISKIRNVIAPYVICSVPAIAAYFIGIKSTETLGAPLWIDSAPKFILYMLITGTHMAPFWFIPMMAIIYIVSPVLVQLDRLPWAYWIIVPLLLLSLAAGRSPGDSNPAQNFVCYLPVYVIGMAVSHYRDRLIPQLAQHYWLLLLFIALPLADISAEQGLDSVEFLTKIVFCLGLVGAFARFAHDLPRWVDYVGSVSFGLYILHYYAVAVLTIAAKSVLHTFFTQGIAAYALVVFGVTGASLIAVMIAKAILGTRSRLVIGA